MSVPLHHSSADAVQQPTSSLMDKESVSITPTTGHSEACPAVSSQVVPRTPSPPLPFSPVKRPYSAIDSVNNTPKRAGSEDSELSVIEHCFKRIDSVEEDVDEEASRAAKRRNVSSSSKLISQHPNTLTGALETPSIGHDDWTPRSRLCPKKGEKLPSSPSAPSDVETTHAAPTSSDISLEEDTTPRRISESVRSPRTVSGVYLPLTSPSFTFNFPYHKDSTPRGVQQHSANVVEPYLPAPPSVQHKHITSASSNMSHSGVTAPRRILDTGRSASVAPSVHHHPTPASASFALNFPYRNSGPGIERLESLRADSKPLHSRATTSNISHNIESHRYLTQEPPPPQRVALSTQHEQFSSTSLGVSHSDKSASHSVHRISPGVFDDLRRLEPKPASVVEKPPWVPLKRVINRRSATPKTFSREPTPHTEVPGSLRDATLQRKHPPSIVSRPASVTTKTVPNAQQVQRPMDEVPLIDLSSDIQLDPCPYSSRSFLGGSRNVPLKESSAMSGVINRPESSTSRTRTVPDIQRVQHSTHHSVSIDLSSDLEIDPYPYSSRPSSPRLNQMQYGRAGQPRAERPSTSNPRLSAQPSDCPQVQRRTQTTSFLTSADRSEHPSSSPSKISFHFLGSRSNPPLSTAPYSSLTPFPSLPPSSPPYDPSPIRGSPLPFGLNRASSAHPSRQPEEPTPYPQQPSQSNIEALPQHYNDPDYVMASQEPYGDERSPARQTSNQPGVSVNNDTLSILLRAVQKIDARLTKVESTRRNPNNSAASRNDEEVDNYQADSEDEPMHMRTRRANKSGSRQTRAPTATANRKRSQDENEYNATIRQLMRELLTPLEYREDGIVTDEDNEVAIPIHSPPNDEELLQFAAGQIPGPTFEDFSIAWLPPGLGRTGSVTKLRQAAHKWNDEAAYVFATTFIERLEAEHYSPASDDWKNKWKGREELEKRFLSKLQNYHATFAEQHYHAATVSEEDRIDYLQKDATRHKKVHANSRRKSLYAMREQTIVYSRKISTEQRQQYLRVLQTVGIGGMTSDETDSEDPDRKRRVTKVWRNKLIDQILRCVDRAYDSKNLLGRDKRGMDKRKFGPPACRVNTNAIIGMPLDYYDPEWLEDISAAEKRRLKPKPPTGLPSVLLEL